MIRASFFLLGCLLVKVGHAAISSNPAETKYFAYTNPATRNELILGDAGSLTAATIRTATKTFLIIDGFLSDSTSPMSQTTKDELLRSNPNTNVIVVDWGKLSGSGATIGNQLETYAVYLKVLENVGPVAQRTADFLNFLKTEKGIDYSQVHIIGHSLGAHIAGATGYWVTSKYSSIIGRATGLDPAGPLFSGQNNVDKRLHKGDATFVDIYHTNRGTLGDSAHQTGDINVYVNGGASQPGCEEADSSGFAGYCSHSYSWQLWNSCSISNNCNACPCAGYDCQCATCSPTCSNGINLGLNTPTSARGAYYVSNGPLA
ncbi:Lipase member H [Orchesella cincta]|uniref:Lipase member H n=1 Tax=Orchesella cincta TaxID=48709 RepID=A0A1D2MV08_ORCCI|nr:Lipase member H [Orchesella cincta]